MKPDAHQVKRYLLQLQETICQKLSAIDGGEFVEDSWQFDDDKLNTLHHLGAGTFVTSGKRVTAG